MLQDGVRVHKQRNDDFRWLTHTCILAGIGSLC